MGASDIHVSSLCPLVPSSTILLILKIPVMLFCLLPDFSINFVETLIHYQMWRKHVYTFWMLEGAHLTELYYRVWSSVLSMHTIDQHLVSTSFLQCTCRNNLHLHWDDTNTLWQNSDNIHLPNLLASLCLKHHNYLSQVTFCCYNTFMKAT